MPQGFVRGQVRMQLRVKVTNDPTRSGLSMLCASCALVLNGIKSAFFDKVYDENFLSARAADEHHCGAILKSRHLVPMRRLAYCPWQTHAALATAFTLYRAMGMTFWLPQAEAALAQVEG